MLVGDRIRAISESKKLSQGDIEQRSQLLRCYISRVENSHTIPSIETLEKIARALEIETCQLFLDSDRAPKDLKLPKLKNGTSHLSAKEQRQAMEIGRLFTRIKRPRDRQLVTLMVRKLAR
jgi:transcriptional regulator with XRE-family HTH domain